MSNTRDPRREAGMWLFGILGLIFAAIGIRYASSNEWWGNIFNPGNRQALQTINTGVSVPVSASLMTSVPASVPNRPGVNASLLGPNSNSGAATDGSNQSSQGRKMW